jgi:hypothetical protein
MSRPRQPSRFPKKVSFQRALFVDGISYITRMYIGGRAGQRTEKKRYHVVSPSSLLCVLLWTVFEGVVTWQPDEPYKDCDLRNRREQGKKRRRKGNEERE